MSGLMNVVDLSVFRFAAVWQDTSGQVRCRAFGTPEAAMRYLHADHRPGMVLGLGRDGAVPPVAGLKPDSATRMCTASPAWRLRRAAGPVARSEPYSIGRCPVTGVKAGTGRREVPRKSHRPSAGVPPLAAGSAEGKCSVMSKRRDRNKGCRAGAGASECVSCVDGLTS